MNLAAGCERELQPGVHLHSGLALYLEEEATLVVADLHWAYASSQQRYDFLVPLWGADALEIRLHHLLEFYQPHRMVWLGDSLHRVHGRAPAEAFLAEISRDVETSVIQGNHDRFWDRAHLASVQLGRFFLHHGDQALPVPEGTLEIIGHEHPTVTSLEGVARNLKVPTLVQSPRRLILPAFSPWAASLDWIPHLLPDEKLWAIFPEQILPWPVSATDQFLPQVENN